MGEWTNYFCKWRRCADLRLVCKVTNIKSGVLLNYRSRTHLNNQFRTETGLSLTNNKTFESNYININHNYERLFLNEENLLNKYSYMKKIPLCFLILITFSSNAQTQRSLDGIINNLPVHEYTLTIREEMVNKTGKEVMDMTKTKFRK